MTRWEHRLVSIRGSIGYEGVASELNTMGESGWELVSLTSDRGELIATFKRPLQRASPEERDLTMERETTRRSRVA